MAVDHMTHGHVEAKAHKSPNYFVVFITLGVITAIITAVELFRDTLAFVPDGVIYTAFIIMSLTKATLVAMYYMHLKFDSFVYTAFFSLGVLTGLFLVIILSVNYLIL